MMNQKAGSSQIFGQALPRVEQEGDFAASQQPAQGWFLTKCRCGAGIRSDPSKQPHTPTLWDGPEERAQEHPRAWSGDSPSLLEEGVHQGGSVPGLRGAWEGGGDGTL